MARKRSVLTQAQSQYVEGVLDGKSRPQAAEEAGYAHPATIPNVIERSEAVRRAIQTARSELSSAAQMKRADVLLIFIDAVELARIAGDPTAMVAGGREIGKMLGLYEPEKKEIQLTTGQARLRTLFENKSDEELLSIIEGDYARLDS